MENRFGIKDFFLFLFLTVVIVLIVLAMVQFDRQWKKIQLIGDRIDSQGRDIRDIQDKLASGAVSFGSGGGMTTRPTEIDPKRDPFARIRVAQEHQNYAKGGLIIDAFGNTVGNLTPLISQDAYASVIQGYVLESLATRDPSTLEWRPLLSSDWKVQDNSKAYADYVAAEKQKGRTDEEIAKDAGAPDAITITFTMRQGPQFSDGTPVTADDVVFTYNFVMDPKINAPRDRAYLTRITKVEKTGPEQVTFTFREPYFEAFELAGSISILPKHFYSAIPPEEFNQAVGYLLGSGPYRLQDPKSWKPGTLIQLVRNERYWGVQPAFDRMIWREITNDVAHLQAFRNADIDAFPAQPEQYKEMIADAALVARTQHFEYQNPVGGYRYIAWNQKRNGEPTMFADKRVRQALTMLLDRDRMIQEIMLGYAVPATGPFNPLSKQYNPEIKPWPYDVSRAKQLLKEAGFEDRNGDGVIENAAGQRFEFKLTYPSGSANYEKMALFFKDSYARAGIILNPDPLDWAVLVERLNNKNYEAITLGWTAGIETDIFQMFHSSMAQAGGDNFMSYLNPQLDKFIEQARTTVDEGTRIPLWREAHKILHEDVPYTFLFFPKSLVFLDKRIHNVEKTKLGLNPREEWFVPAEQQRMTQ